ncbi:unnamed protein product [Lampetra fluviatilis]
MIEFGFLVTDNVGGDGGRGEVAAEEKGQRRRKGQQRRGSVGEEVSAGEGELEEKGVTSHWQRSLTEAFFAGAASMGKGARMHDLRDCLHGPCFREMEVGTCHDKMPLPPRDLSESDARFALMRRC